MEAASDSNPPADEQAPEAYKRLTRNRVWPELPPPRQVFPLISDPAGRLGTLDQAIGAEAAEAFFNEPNPFDEARIAALEAMYGPGVWS